MKKKECPVCKDYKVGEWVAIGDGVMDCTTCMAHFIYKGGVIVKRFDYGEFSSERDGS